jgi:hypothetical protein
MFVSTTYFNSTFDWYQIINNFVNCWFVLSCHMSVLSKYEKLPLFYIKLCIVCFFFFFFQYIKCYPQCPAIHLFFMRLLHNNNQSNVLYFIFPRSKIIVCWFITHYEGSAICKTLLANGQNCPLVCSSKENLAQLFPLLWCFWRKRLKYFFLQKSVVILCWKDTF